MIAVTFFVVFFYFFYFFPPSFAQVLEKTGVPIFIYDKATDEIHVPKVEILEPDHAPPARSAAGAGRKWGGRGRERTGRKKRKS